MWFIFRRRFKYGMRLNRSEAGKYIADVCRVVLGHSWHQEVALLLGTAAVESRFESRYQIGGGPARGLWQMEIRTALDIFENYLRYKSHVYRRLYRSFPNLLTKEFGIPNQTNLEHALVYDDRFACAMARIHYLRVPSRLPYTLPGQAAYWKTHYNTAAGAGTVAGYREAWEECGCDMIMRDWKRHGKNQQEKEGKEKRADSYRT